jgi:Nucleotidyl transferase AbiEii toxin, Type IV TA system
VSDHPFAALPDRGKPPTSKRHLDQWIQQAQPKTGVAVGRLGWIVASSVVIAALQRARADDGNPRFLLKGGAYLEVRLGLRARATKDIDTLFRGEFSEFVDVLDAALAESWGAIELERTEIETITRARRVIKPVRFRVKLLVSGQTWRTIDVEVAADEGRAGATVASFPAPSLSHFGLPSAIGLAGIVFDYQVAQKLHACSDPHDPPDARNDRARDLVDLLLIRDAFYPDGHDLSELRAACLDLFEARTRDAQALGLEPRSWPPSAHAHHHWATDYGDAAHAVGQTTTLTEAADLINEWISRINSA